MPQRIGGIRRILAVASGKGGVGKTTVTVNLALALAMRGARVGLFDADIYGPNVPLMLGVSRTEKARGWLPVGRTDNTPYIPPLDRFGLKVMSIGLLVSEREAVMPDPHFAGLIVTRTLKDVLWGSLDYLVVDLPPGTGEPEQSLVQTVQIDGAVVVTTPQDLSLLDAGRSLELFRQAGVPVLGVIENMSYLTCPDCGKRIEVFHHSNRRWANRDTELELLAEIPMDPGISSAIDAGHPLLQEDPQGEEAAIFTRLADRLAALLDSL